jgi:NitT/TauT family transport system ATP-binding protein
MLQLRGASKTFRRGDYVVDALAPIDLTVETGEFVTILGPSGCGKTTLLHLLGGFELPTTGSVEIDGRPITGPGRDRGMVFQEATLFPWRSIRANVAWPMEVRGIAQRTALAKADELLVKVGLEGFGDAQPAELSGGMRQRAALARTLAMEPSVLLMDEPFGALDAQTREVMQEELTRLWQQSGLTVVFITHDITEAIFLGDRVIVMGAAPGRIVEDCRIDLGRPRTAETKADPRILAYRAQLWDLIRPAAEALRPDRMRVPL